MRRPTAVRAICLKRRLPARPQGNREILFGRQHVRRAAGRAVRRAGSFKARALGSGAKAGAEGVETDFFMKRIKVTLLRRPCVTQIFGVPFYQKNLANSVHLNEDVLPIGRSLWFANWGARGAPAFDWRTFV